MLSEITKKIEAKLQASLISNKAQAEVMALVNSIESTVLAKLTAGVEVPDLRDFAISDRAHIDLIAAFQEYGASQRLAGREQAIEEAIVGNTMTYTRIEALEALRALAASPQEQI